MHCCRVADMRDVSVGLRHMGMPTTIVPPATVSTAAVSTVTAAVSPATMSAPARHRQRAASDGNQSRPDDADCQNSCHCPPPHA